MAITSIKLGPGRKFVYGLGYLPTVYPYSAKGVIDYLGHNVSTNLYDPEVKANFFQNNMKNGSFVCSTCGKILSLSYQRCWKKPWAWFETVKKTLYCSLDCAH